MFRKAMFHIVQKGKTLELFSFFFRLILFKNLQKGARLYFHAKPGGELNKSSMFSGIKSKVKWNTFLWIEQKLKRKKNANLKPTSILYRTVFA